MDSLKEQIAEACERIAENQRKVYDKGFEQGKNLGGYNEGFEEGKTTGYDEGYSAGTAEGYSEGFSAGEKSQYDEFWENYLAEPKATGSGALIFAGRGWNDKTFNPPYKIDFITNGYQIFAYAGNIPKDKLAMVDYSKITTNFNQTFMYSNITELPRIDTRGSSAISSVWSSCNYLITFEALVLREDGSQTINEYCFSNCFALENLIIEGVIGSNVFNVQWSTKLSKASWISIMTAASTTASITITGSLVSVNKAFETSPGANDGSTSPEWLALKAARPTVSVSLV